MPEGPSWLSHATPGATPPPPSGWFVEGSDGRGGGGAAAGGCDSDGRGRADELGEAIRAALEAEDEAAGLRLGLDAANRLGQRAARETAVLRLRGSRLAAATVRALGSRV